MDNIFPFYIPVLWPLMPLSTRHSHWDVFILYSTCAELNSSLDCFHPNFVPLQAPILASGPISPIRNQVRDLGIICGFIHPLSILTPHGIYLPTHCPTHHLRQPLCPGFLFWVSTISNSSSRTIAPKLNIDLLLPNPPTQCSTSYFFRTSQPLWPMTWPGEPENQSWLLATDKYPSIHKCLS